MANATVDACHASETEDEFVSRVRANLAIILIGDLRCSSPWTMDRWSGMQSSFIDRTIPVSDEDLLLCNGG